MPAPRSIGLVCPAWVPDVGAAATQTEALSRVLLAAGLRPFVLAGERDPRRAVYTVRDERVAGVSVRRINLPQPAPTSARELQADPRVQALGRAWIADLGLELVHALDVGPFGQGALGAGQDAGLPTVATLMDFAPLCARRRLVAVDGTRCDGPQAENCAGCQAATWLRMAPDPDAAGWRTSRALACLRGTRVLLAPAQATIETYVRAGLERARLELCPPGTENQTLAAAVELARAGMPSGRRLGVLGSTRPSGGVIELAHAVCMAARPGLTLEVHGPLVDSHGDATYLNALRRLADMDPRVRLHGPYPRHELPRVLATLDGVAAPDTWSGGPALGLREARAAGLPVLASPWGVHAEFADDPGVSLVSGGSIEDWSIALTDFEFQRTRPAPVRSLLSMAEQVLDAYRRAARCGPVPATFERSNVQPKGPSSKDAPRPSSI
jgi:glycosyltransferase involved in cell wall biosynthesis